MVWNYSTHYRHNAFVPARAQLYGFESGITH